MGWTAGFGIEYAIYACHRKDVDACADLWGGRVVMGKEELNAKAPGAPVEMTKGLCCPLLGIFGNDDRAPSPEQVNAHEAELKKHGKMHEFYRYDGGNCEHCARRQAPTTAINSAGCVTCLRQSFSEIRSIISTRFRETSPFSGGIRLS